MSLAVSPSNKLMKFFFDDTFRIFFLNLHNNIHYLVTKKKMLGQGNSNENLRKIFLIMSLFVCANAEHVYKLEEQHKVLNLIG